MWEWLTEKNGNAIVVNYLMNLDVSDFRYGRPAPDTDWRRTMVEASQHRDTLTSLVKELIENKSLPFNHDIVKLSEAVEGLRAVLKLSNDSATKINNYTLTRSLTDLGCVYSGVLSVRPEPKANPIALRYWAVRNKDHWSKVKVAKTWFDAYTSIIPETPKPSDSE
jgi:hypothetical protein